MMKKITLTLIILAIFAMTFQIASAQEAMILTSDDEISTQDFPNISFDVTPINRSGVPIEQLTLENFTVRENGQPVEDLSVQQFTDEAENISIMLVLDVSGSLSDNVDELKEAARVLFNSLNILPGEDEVGLITFSLLEDGTSVNLSDPFPQFTENRETDFTGDGGLLGNLIEQLVIEENAGTPLYDAMFKGVRLAQNATYARRAVIVMTDGVDSDRDGNVDEGSAIATANDPIELAQDNGIPIFTVGLGNNIDDGYLQRAATLTGGVYQNTSDPEALGQLFSTVATQLKQKYFVQYESAALPDESLYDITVTVDSPEGDATISREVRAPLPEVPFIREVMVTLPNQDPRPLSDTRIESLIGNVLVQPQISQRGTLQEVRYFVDDAAEPFATTTSSPWQIDWNTSELEAGEHVLRIEAVTTDETPFVGSFSREVEIQPCSSIPTFCQVQIFTRGVSDRTGISPQLLLIGVIGLLLLFVLLLLWRRRRNRITSAVRPQTFQSGTAASSLNSLDRPTNQVPPPTQNGAGLEFSGPFDSGDNLGLNRATDGQPTTEIFSPQPQQVPQQPNPFEVARDKEIKKTVVLSRKPLKRASLIHVNGGSNFPLKDQTTIGRIADNEIRLDDEAVSNNHSIIKLEDEKFVFYDLAPTNPSEINGARVNEPRALEDGDRINIGSQSLVFKKLPD